MRLVGPQLAVVCLFAACAQDRAAVYAAALKSGDCGAIDDPELRTDCQVQTDQCEALTGEDAAECWFLRAEKNREAAACANAGAFAFDCRMHLYTRALQVEVKDARVEPDESGVAARIAAAGFEPADMRPWSAWYRHALARRRPLDRSVCRALTDPAHQQACLQTGLSLYNDYLNVARDRHLYKCDGGPLPELLQTTPDPELDALRATRGDPCAR